MLGAALGPSDFCSPDFSTKLDRADSLMSQLIRLQSPVTALVPLHFCLSWCQITTLARCHSKVLSSARNRCKLRTNAAWESSSTFRSRMTPGDPVPHQPLAWHPAVAQTPSARTCGLRTVVTSDPQRSRRWHSFSGNDSPRRSLALRGTGSQPQTHLSKVTQGDRSSLEIHQVPARLGLAPGWNPELLQTAPQHRLPISILTRETQCSLRFTDHAAVCGCAGDRSRPHNADEAGLHPPKQEGGLLQPRADTDRLPQRASLDRPADVRIPHGEDSTPEAWDCAVTSCPRPATRMAL